MTAISFQSVNKTFTGARGAFKALDGVIASDNDSAFVEFHRSVDVGLVSVRPLATEEVSSLTSDRPLKTLEGIHLSVFAQDLFGGFWPRHGFLVVSWLDHRSRLLNQWLGPSILRYSISVADRGICVESVGLAQLSNLSILLSSFRSSCLRYCFP